MPITRVELRSDRLSRRRDNRLLLASHLDVDSLKDSDTLSASADDTGGAPSSRPLDEALRAQINLTRSLASKRQSAEPDREIASPRAKHRLTGPTDSSPVVNKDGEIAGIDQVSRKKSEPAEAKRPGSEPSDKREASTDLESAIVESVLDQSTVDSRVSAEAKKDASASPIEKADIAEAPTKETPEVIKAPPSGQSRLDLITGEWTLFASTRSQRPNQFAEDTPPVAKALDCPFCAGQEHRTPDPVWIARLDDNLLSDTTGCTSESTDWAVRVVPNLFPAVSHQPPPETSNKTIDHGSPRSSVPLKTLFPHESANGGHEVIIEAPRHTESLGELNTAEISLVFAAYAQRIRYWQGVEGIHHVSVFKNVGRDAGASLQHSHSQLIATNRVPAVVQQVTRRMQAHFARTGSCLQCDLVRGEIEQKSRIVSQTDSFVAYCPYASRFPLQVRITSKEHLACFGEMRAPHLAEVSRLVLRVVRWLEALRPGTAYNMLLHTCPVHFQGARDSQHWAMDIFPRMSRLAGFELATGAMINPIYPETATKAYREKARQNDPRYVLR